MNKIFEQHVIKLEVNIKQLHFQIILPVKINFVILVDGKIASESRKIYSLQTESCLPFQKHICEFNADFDAKKNIYLFKQIAIVTHYHASKGIEGSKLVKFEPLTKNTDEKEWILPAETTSDFRLVFLTSFTVISKKIKSSRIISTVNDPTKLASPKKDGNYERRSSAIHELTRPERQGSNRQSQIQIFQRQNIIDKTKRLQNFKSVPLDTKRRNAKNRLVSPKNAEQSDQTTKGHHDELDNLRKKIEIEREQKVRSITKLKMQSPNFLATESKEEITELAKLKQRVKFYEKKEKTTQKQIQDLNQELEKRKNKINSIEKKTEQLEKSISQRDIKLKVAQSTIKSLNEQLDSIMSKQRAVGKKGEAKQAALRDQLRKMQQKFRIQQLQMLKVNQQKNSNIKGIQFYEKLHQNALKQKDIKLNQQKSKYYKFKQQYEEKQKFFNFTIEQLTAKIQGFEIQKNRLSDKIIEFQQHSFGLENEIAILKESLKREREQYERLVEQNVSKQTGDLNSARIRYNQLVSQCNLLKDKVSRLQADRSQLEGKMKSLEDSLKNKNNEINKNNMRINGLKQQLSSANDEVAKKSRELQVSKQSNTNLKQKLSQMKQKADEQKKGREQANLTLDKYMNDFKREKQCLQAQIKDLKWSIVRNNDTITELQFQIKDQKAVNLKISEENMAKSQKLSNTEENLREAQLQKQNLSKQKNNLALRLKQLNESIRIKSNEIQQQKKSRVKTQQRLQQQKQRSKQQQLFQKQRQNQQQQKRRQREGILARKLQQINRLDLEMSKKQQEIGSLKSSNESILREIQLCKMDSEGLKNELTILESSFKNLKQQNANLIRTQESLNSKLSASEQNLNILSKRFQLLQKEYNEYKESIQQAFENLFNQLFKEEANSSNIIAATLLPFPTQKLSILQVQLVQKRNNFIIKSRQKISDLQNQVDSLSHQIDQIKQLYENRQQVSKQYDTQQRDKLKQLLYEGMLQKNGISEQLLMERKEKEQLQKQIERLKGEIFKRDDIEQQLNGQLHLLMLEYDGVKSQNQDLGSMLFKYKQQEIKNKSDFEQRMGTLQEQTSLQIQKMKMENLQAQRKIIQLEKQLLDLSDKIRKFEEQKLRSYGQLELGKESLRISQQKISHYQLQITKLNNILKNMENKQANLRDIIDKLEGQSSQLANKNQILQNSLIRVTSQHFQINIEKQKLIGELSNTKERCSELEKLLHEKGQTNKEKIERKMQQNSQLKSELIQKNSDLELKEFYLKQKQQQNQALNDENQELKKNNKILKAKTRELLNSIEESEVKGKQLTRSIQQLLKQKQKKQQMLTQSNFFILSLQHELEEANSLNSLIQAKERECIQLRQAKNESQEYYMSELKKAKETSAQLRRQLKNERDRVQMIEDEYKNNLQSITKSNNQRYKYLEIEFLQQKDDFGRRVQQIDAHNKKVISQFEAKVQKLKQELLQAKDNQKSITDDAYKKQTIIRNLSKRNEQLENEMDDYKQKYNKYYNLYQQNKADFNQNTKENQSKLLNNLQKSKISQIKQYASRIKQIERKIQRLKYSDEFQIKTETLSKRQFRNIRDRIFAKLLEAIRQSQQQEVWEGSRVDPVY